MLFRSLSSQTRREIHGGLLSCRIQSTPRASVQIDGEKTPIQKVDSEVPPVRLEEATTSPSRNEKPHAPMRTREGSLRRRVPSPSRTGRHVCRATFTTAALYGSGEKHDECLVLSPSALATYRNDGKNQPDTRKKIPLGVAVREPVLAWQVPGTEPATAYEVEVRRQ